VYEQRIIIGGQEFIMTSPRSEVLLEGEESIYHCISRCVRRGYLYGKDKYTGKDYSHRKDWIRDRLKFLVSVFNIEALACALMDNHQHLMLRTRPDLLAELSAEEVAIRWLTLYPKDLNEDKSGPAEHEITAITRDKKRLKELKRRLGSISWFMKSLNEYISRKANKEDGCKGAFWEGRFKCQRVEGSAAILSCAVYIDLNPIRAKVATTPEESEYTSAYERIKTLGQKKGPDALQWLAPVQDTATRKGFLDMSLKEYLEIVDATGREMRKGKRGRIDPELEPILQRLGIETSEWLKTTSTFRRSFSRLAAPPNVIRAEAEKYNKKWFKGVRLAQCAFIG
jgi:REP element-mobilizing transposase RayT